MSKFVLDKKDIFGLDVSMELNTTEEKVRQWESMSNSERPLIQKFFPELNEDEREFILTGLTNDSWDELFDYFDEEFDEDFDDE